jgi:hypothetical protein
MAKAQETQAKQASKGSTAALSKVLAALQRSHKGSCEANGGNLKELLISRARTTGAHWPASKACCSQKHDALSLALAALKSMMLSLLLMHAAALMAPKLKCCKQRNLLKQAEGAPPSQLNQRSRRSALSAIAGSA